MKKYILDASVVLTFLLGKEKKTGGNFLQVLNQVKSKKAKLYSTHLLPLEVGNGLRFSLDSQELAKEVMQKFLNLPIEYFFFSSAQYGKILQMSYLFKASFYDTSYHFLAKFLKGTFLTCDNEYYQRAKKFGYIKFL